MTPQRVGSLLGPDLLDALEELHPPLVPTPGTTMDEIMFESGKRSLINYMRFCHAAASENILENT